MVRAVLISADSLRARTVRLPLLFCDVDEALAADSLPTPNGLRFPLVRSPWGCDALDSLTFKSWSRAQEIGTCQACCHGAAAFAAALPAYARCCRGTTAPCESSQ